MAVLIKQTITRKRGAQTGRRGSPSNWTAPLIHDLSPNGLHTKLGTVTIRFPSADKTSRWILACLPAGTIGNHTTAFEAITLVLGVKVGYKARDLNLIQFYFLVHDHSPFLISKRYGLRGFKKCIAIIYFF